MWYVPNALTITRIAVTPIVLILMMTPTFTARLGALLLFILASASDWLDGKLARSMDASSQLGKFLDPLADKILVLGTFIILAVEYPRVAPWWAVFVIAFRDVLVTVLRMWARSRGYSVQTLYSAKAKTASQLVYLIGMLGVLAASHLTGTLGTWGGWLLTESITPLIVLYIVVLLTVYTGGIYVYRVGTLLMKQNPASN